MSAIVPENNPIVTRLRKKRDLETTMTALKQLLEPSMKKGSRKKNKPRSIAKKTPKLNRFENISIGEYYPNKLKRKVRLKKTVLRPKHDLKVVVATNKRKRCTPLKGIDFSLSTDETRDSTNLTPSNTKQKPTEYLNIHTTIPSSSMYKLISPPHRSLTQLTVDDLIRMDEDSLSGEDMMEILTCPSPVWWEDPTEVTGGTVYLTEASKPFTSVNENSREKTTTENMLKRSSINVSASKAKKIAKLENILGHIKSLVKVDEGNTKKIKDSVDTVDKDDSVITEDRVKLEVNETDKKRRKVSSSGSEISVNEEELLRNLENIDIPINNTVIGDCLDDDVTKTCNDLSVDKVEEKNLNGEEKSPINKTNSGKTKTKRRRGNEVLLKNKIVSVTKKQRKDINMIDKNKDTENDVSKTNKEKPPVPDKSILKRLDKHNDDILDIRLIKIPTNATNEVKVWSKLDNFKRHNFKPSDFGRNADEYEIPVFKSNIKEKDPLEIDNDTILIDDDDSNDSETAVETVNVEQTQLTMTKINTNNENISEITLESVKETELNEEVENKETNIIKEDTIRISNDLDIKLIETDNAETKPEVEINDIKLNKSTKSKVSTHFKAESGWHVKHYLKFGKETNTRGIFRVEDDADDTILCINDVDVSLIKNPKLKENDTYKDTEMNDVSITLVSKCKVSNTNKIISESPKSIKSVSSESIAEVSDTISDTNIQFIDEYENKSGCPDNDMMCMDNNKIPETN